MAHTVFSMFKLILCGTILYLYSSPTDTSKENGTTRDPLDVRLLTGLVQDVWDKFFHLKESVLIRQKHETEALWLVQQELWRQRLSELGEY